MPQVYKRKKEAIDETVILEALTAVQRGMSVNAAALHFDLPESTLRWRNKAALSDKTAIKVGTHPSLPAHTELELASIIKVAAKQGFGFSMEEMKLFISDYVKRMGMWELI
jgi:transposase-like protein